MRGVATILMIVLCAACADGGLPPLAGDQVPVRFPPRSVGGVIEGDSINPPPLRKVEVLPPPRQAPPAPFFNVHPSLSVTSRQGLPNGPYAGDAFGVGNIAAGIPPSALSAGAPQQRAAFLAMISTASIPLPDPVEYRRDWRSYRVRLSFGDA